MDCANGAAAGVAPGVLARAGAEVVAVLGVDPDGVNINEGCGSTYPAGLQAAVIAHGADVGLAFDGDADRVIAVDERGAVVDGDQLIALFALDLRSRGRLAGDTVAVTVMTNLGFRLAMQADGCGGARDQRRRPLRARSPRSRRLVPRRRAVGPHHLPGRGHHGRRDPDRAATCSTLSAGRAGRWRSWPPRPCPGCLRCCATSASPTGPAWRAPRRSGRRWPAGGGAGRPGPGPAPPERHRAAGAGDGRGADRGGGPGGRGPAGRHRHSLPGLTATSPAGSMSGTEGGRGSG